MVTEEFSFPTISNNIGQLTDTPSLWRISSRVSPNFDEFAGNGRRNLFIRRSFSGIGDQDLIEEEESMDLLWENFNDDRCCCDEEISEIKSSSESCSCSATDFDHCIEENGSGICSSTVKALKVCETNTNGDWVSGKKHRMALVLKVMKKILWLRKIAKHNNKREKVLQPWNFISK